MQGTPALLGVGLAAANAASDGSTWTPAPIGLMTIDCRFLVFEKIAWNSNRQSDPRVFERLQSPSIKIQQSTLGNRQFGNERPFFQVRLMPPSQLKRLAGALPELQAGSSRYIHCRGSQIYIRNLNDDEGTPANAASDNSPRNPRFLPQRTRVSAFRPGYTVVMTICTNQRCALRLMRDYVKIPMRLRYHPFASV